MFLTAMSPYPAFGISDNPIATLVTALPLIRLALISERKLDVSRLGGTSLSYVIFGLPYSLDDCRKALTEVIT